MQTSGISLATLVLLLALNTTALAQARLTGADLSGVVVDQSGAIVPGVTITVTNLETNILRTFITEGDGRYFVPALPPGTYTVTTALQGFAPLTRKLLLALGEAVNVDFELTVAPLNEAATVIAEAPLVQIGRTELSSVVNQQQIDTLPINGRNFVAFAVITAGVSTDRTPQQGATTTTGLSFAGQRARSNNIMVDGFDNNDQAVGGVRATFSQEAIREFQVLANSYSAEFGKAAGGVVNIVTKSGTNGLHGNTFLYFRDRALNAKNYFERFDLFGNPVNLPKAPFNQKQWGATLGGPIRKDKSFFFLSYERTDLADSRLVTIDPSAVAVLNTLGFPVELGSVPLNVANSEVLAKIDHQWRSNHSFVGRGTYADISREGIDDFGGTVARSRGTVQDRLDWSVSATQTDVLTSRWLSELRTEFSRDDQKIRGLDPRCGPACLDAFQGGPTLEITGVASVGRQRFTPQLRLNNRLQVMETLSYFRGRHQFKAGAEYNHFGLPDHGNELPLHFGGRYIFSAIPALGIPTALDALKRGFPAAYVQGYGNWIYPARAYGDISFFAQNDWRLDRTVIKTGLRYQKQTWQDFTFNLSDVGGGRFSYPMPGDANNLAPRVAVARDLTGNGRTWLHGAYGIFYDNIIAAITETGRLISGAQDGLRTLALTAPRASIAWNAPDHRLSEEQASALLGGSFPSTAIAPQPSLQTGFSHQFAAGVEHLLGANFTLNVSGVYVRGFNLPGTLDYNPILPATLGPNRRPDDLPCSARVGATCVNGGIPGTSASVLQYTSFGESWYKGLTLSLSKRLAQGYQLLVSYTLSKAEDTSTDFQSNFIPQTNGLGRNPVDRAGLPVSFDPASEKGPATHDQRHRLVLSGTYQAPWNLQLSGIVTAASGRPFTPLAGADLNGDGNGGSFPPDRARVNPLDISSSVGRDSQTTAAQYTVDVRVSKRIRLNHRLTLEAFLEAFNALNRANFFEDTNQSSFVIFGTGAFPNSPLPAYGRYTLTLPPRQVQLAAKIIF